MTKSAPPKNTAAKIRPWKVKDIPAILECQRAAYPDLPEKALCTDRHYRLQLRAFPQGQLLAECDGEVVGYATSLILQIPDELRLWSYAELTGVGTFSTHSPSGDTLYGADIAVRPDYRGQGISKLLYEKRRRLMRRYNLRRLVAGGRIPGYSEHAATMSPETYIKKVKDGEIADSSLRAHLSAGYDVKGVHIDYFSDEASLNYATLLEMPNPLFDASKRMIAAGPLSSVSRTVRVCAMQFQMQRIQSWEQFAQHVHFFVETAAEYSAHIVVFPEFVTAQLFSLMDPANDTEASIRELSSHYTKPYLDLFTQLAKEHQLYILAGSHPIEEDGKIYNRAHLMTPSGNVYTQDKLHVTPGERRQWQVTPGNKITVFDTGIARIAIPICYDIEFPELSRLLALSGAEILLVPFATDEINSYYRVRHCAQARAVENQVYVVMSGIVGNLLGVKSFLINYGQAVVCTPCDVLFPKRGIAAEADATTETVVIYDLNLASLAFVRNDGSVLPLKDRRLDLFETVAKVNVNRVVTE